MSPQQLTMWSNAFLQLAKFNDIVTSCPSTLSWNQSLNLQDAEILTDALDELCEFYDGVVAMPNADIQLEVAGPGVSCTHLMMASPFKRKFN